MLERLCSRGLRNGLRPAISPETAPSRSHSGSFTVAWRAVALRTAPVGGSVPWSRTRMRLRPPGGRRGCVRRRARGLPIRGERTAGGAVSRSGALLHWSTACTDVLVATRTGTRCGLAPVAASCFPSCRQHRRTPRGVGVTYARRVPRRQIYGASRPEHSVRVLRGPERWRGTPTTAYFSRHGHVPPLPKCTGGRNRRDEHTRYGLLRERSGRMLGVYRGRSPRRLYARGLRVIGVRPVLDALAMMPQSSVVRRCLFTIHSQEILL